MQHLGFMVPTALGAGKSMRGAQPAVLSDPCNVPASALGLLVSLISATHQEPTTMRSFPRVLSLETLSPKYPPSHGDIHTQTCGMPF